MLENFIIGILFCLAVFYIANSFRQMFDTSKTGCAKGCGSCGATDLEAQAKKIEANLK